MKIIELEQGSPEWLAWRKSVITATDCSCILGHNPWTTAYKCWQRKLGLIPEQASNEAMERGKRLEPILRDRFIKKYGIYMTPVVAESSEYEFLGASLDGLSTCGKYLLEIKTGNQKLYDMAKEKVIPEYYLDQMQHQLLVTAAEKCFYYVGGEDETKDIIIEVYPDPQFAKEFLPNARDFLKCIAFNEPPRLEDSDYKDMSDTPQWKGFAEEYKKIDQEIKRLEELKNNYKNELLKLSHDQNCSGAGIKLMKMQVKGRVDYEAIPEIKGIELDQYRKNPTTSWKILVS